MAIYTERLLADKPIEPTGKPTSYQVRPKWTGYPVRWVCSRCGGVVEAWLHLRAASCPCGGTFKLDKDGKA